MCDVNVSTGELLRYEVDIYFPGCISVELTRTYKSTSAVAGSMGYGWINNYDIYLKRDENGIVYHDEDATNKVLKFSKETGKSENSDEGITLTRQKDFLVLDKGDKRKYYFPLNPNSSGLARLDAVQDICGNFLKFEYDEHGFLSTLTDTLKRQLLFKFDHAGHIIQITLREQLKSGQLIQKIKYFYDSNNDLIAVEDSMGRSVRYEYNDHLLVREIDPKGISKYWEYDKARRCVRTWRDGGILLRDLKFDEQKKVIKLTDSLGYSTLYVCDDKNNIVSETNPLGEITQNAYDATGNRMASSQGGGGNQEVTVFEEATNCLTEINAKGASKKYYFNEKNLLIKVVDDEGNEWLKEYDEKGRTKRRVAPGGVEWKIEYAPQGYVTKAVNPLGHVIYQERSADGRIVKLSDDLGVILKNEYDYEGNLVAITNAVNRTTRFVHDRGGRLISIVSPDRSVRKMGYDANDNIITMIDEMGHAFRYEYDAGGKPIKETNPLGQSLSLQYNTEQRLIALTNWKGEKATFSYDPLGRPMEAILFDGRIQRYEYDTDSNLIGIINTSGGRTTLEYDAGALKKKIFPDGKEIQFDFKDGFLRFARNADSAITRDFDSRLRLIKEEQGDWQIVFSYDPMDNLIRVEDNSGRVISYSYDQRRRLTRLEDSQHGVHDFRYNTLDLMVEWRMPNGSLQKMEYDEHDKLVGIHTTDSKAREIIRKQFRYDALDRLVGETLYQKDVPEATVTEYEYDAIHRLTQVLRKGTVIDRYQYDANGNIMGCADYATTDIGPGNRLLRAGNIRFEYDTEGNLVARHDDAGTTQYYYNAAGGLAKILHPDNTVAEFRYDPVGRRIGKIHNGKETKYYWNNDTLFQEKSGSDLKKYVFLPSSFIPIGFAENNSNYFIVFDQAATPREVLDLTGQIIWSRNTNVFGRDLVDSPQANLCPFRFQGQYRDQETGLHYNYHRYYYPDIARYITQDPIGLRGGANLYRYVRNPITWIDPFGLFEITVSARCDWNDEQMKAFEEKVERYNQAIEEKQRMGEKGITISPCEREQANLKKLYEKCENPKGEPKNSSPKDKGRAVDCKDDIDHIIDVQMGGAQTHPDVCKNLVPVNASVNRSLGSQIKNQLANVPGGTTGQALTAVNVGQRECPDKTPRTPACN